MKKHVIQLVVLLAFTLFLGSISHAMSYYVKYVPQPDISYCNNDYFDLGVKSSYEMPADGRVSILETIDGVVIVNGDNPLSGYFAGTVWFMRDILPPRSNYVYKRTMTFYSPSGAMPTINYHFRLACDAGTVSIESWSW